MSDLQRVADRIQDLEDQLAAERAARLAAESEASYLRAARSSDADAWHTAAELLRGLVETRDQQIAALREAIRLARNRDYEGGPCWCWSADTEQGYYHDSYCKTLRALLAPPAGDAAS